MEQIEVTLGERSYPIRIGPGLLDDREWLRGLIGRRGCLVVTNETVAPLYLSRLEAALGDAAPPSIVLPDGEQHKTLATFAEIIDRLIAGRYHRDACLLALGGGVVGDVTGFAAACYQRGIDFVQIPTTLLAQVDSAVGGKTAVNHPHAKNMIGAFHQPTAVLTDTDTLATLPPRELAAGLAEVVKYGIIVDAAFFEWLERHIDELAALDAGALAYAIRRSCEIKAAIVAEDERERGRRALLNLGHTFGHALEALGGYERWLHGEAVAIGMHLAARASAALGWIDATDADKIEVLLRRAGLPVGCPGLDPDAILDRMQLDKKADVAGLRLVLLQRIGEAAIVPAPETALLRRVLREHART